jgi:hypothetical protein
MTKREFELAQETYGEVLFNKDNVLIYYTPDQLDLLVNLGECLKNAKWTANK